MQNKRSMQVSMRMAIRAYADRANETKPALPRFYMLPSVNVNRHQIRHILPARSFFLAPHLSSPIDAASTAMMSQALYRFLDFAGISHSCLLFLPKVRPRAFFGSKGGINHVELACLNGA